MAKKQGTISVSTENIFPIIRKWLYSDQDIFIRELISNATDAIVKLDRLNMMGEADLPGDESFAIEVVYDSEAGTLKFTDNGIGMTAEEVDSYINDIAYSGAVDFVNKCQDAGESGEGIIGHFGLGFYSSFMVADKVSIDTLSYKPGSTAAHWESETGIDYVMDDSDYAKRGTTITIELNDEAKEQISGASIRETITKYCEFMPRPIYFTDVVADRKQKEEREKRYQDDLAAYNKRKEEAASKNEDFDEVEPAAPVDREPAPMNDVEPLWLKNPSQCKDEDYSSFYHKACRDFRDPLFWIHLNMDYPFALKGILYFPQMENRYQTLDGRVKLYSGQVYVADNLKEVIPDFLFLLKGFIDCPDLPLNVSRSYLQNDGYVRKLSDHIVRKVADKLNQIFENDRPSYEKYWQDIHVFIKYGAMRDEKFYKRIKDSLLFVTVAGEYKTAEELGETIYYTVDKDRQINYIRRAEKSGKTVVVMDDELDVPFMSYIEANETGRKFVRIDTAMDEEGGQESWLEGLTGLFRGAVGKDDLKVEVKAHGEDELAATLVETEESRRSQEMRKTFERMQGRASDDMDWDAMFPVQRTLQVNTDSPLVSRLFAMADIPDKKAEAEEMAKEIYDIACLSHGSLTGDALNEFLKRSTKLLGKSL